MLHTFAAKWISGSVISKRLTQEVMSSSVESTILVRFIRTRSCMCFKRGGNVSFHFFSWAKYSIWQAPPLSSFQRYEF